MSEELSCWNCVHWIGSEAGSIIYCSELKSAPEENANIFCPAFKEGKAEDEVENVR